MKNIPTFATLSALGLCLIGASTYAADPAQPVRPVNPVPPVVHPVRPERPIIIDRPAKPGHPAPPQHARPALPDDVKELIAEFQKAREEFLAARREALKNAKDATKEARTELREKLKANVEKFLEEQKARRQEIHDRLAELRGKMKNDQSRPTGQAKDAARP